MNEPIVSVVLTTFNSFRTLEIAIKSVLDQKFKDFELLVIGDCCTDKSEEIVSLFNDNRIKWINLSINSGSQSHPNSVGMQLSKGKYIAFLGHDDIWFPNHLSTLVYSIEEKKVDFVYCTSILLIPNLNHSVVGERLEFSEISLLNYNSHIPPSSWLFKKEIFIVCGNWQNPYETIFSIDVDYLRRIVAKGYQLYYVDAIFIAKFPSHWWNAYSRKDNFPQERYYELIKSDRALAEKTILKECVNSLSQKTDVKLSFKQITRLLIKSIYFSCINFYGIHRFPVYQLLLLKKKMNLKTARKVRGLN